MNRDRIIKINEMINKVKDKQVYKQEQDIQSVSDDELKRRREELFARVKDELRQEGWVPPVGEIDVNVDSIEVNEENNDYPPDSETDNPNDNNT